MGLIIPVCECDVVPLTRRLYTKGLPPAIGIAFLLSAPVMNPIVLLSTYTAFGFGPIFWGRIGISLIVAIITGLVFSGQPESEVLVEQSTIPICSIHTHTNGEKLSFKENFVQLVQIATEELFEMGQYLIMGSLLAALMQTLLPQNTLLALGTGPLISILLLIGLAVSAFYLLYRRRFRSPILRRQFLNRRHPRLSCLRPHGGYQIHFHVQQGIQKENRRLPGDDPIIPCDPDHIIRKLQVRDMKRRFP